MKNITHIIIAALSGMASLQAGPDANALENCNAYWAAWNANWDKINQERAARKAAETQEKILAEMQEQTRLLKAQQPLVISDPTVRPVPVTLIPIR